MNKNKELSDKYKLYDKMTKDTGHIKEVQKHIINIISNKTTLRISDLMKPLYIHVLNKYQSLDEYTLGSRGPYSLFIKDRIIELLDLEEIELLNNNSDIIQWIKYEDYLQQPYFNLISEESGYIRVPKEFNGKIIINI